MRFYCNQQCLVCSKIRTRSAASPCLPFGTSMKSCSVAALLLVWASSLDPTTSAPQSTAVVVEPYELGFRVAWRDTLDGHASEDYEPMTILVSELTERDAKGKPVGVRTSPSHHFMAADTKNKVSSEGNTLVYLEGIPATEVSVSTMILGGFTSVTVSAHRYLDSGNSTTLEPPTVLKIASGTIRLDVVVNEWPFCTPFGWFGGVACQAEAQDILLELPGALPKPPNPPPPHTLLIPRCEGGNLATLRFVCDPRLPGCTDLASVKFYLGHADQPTNKAPNFATIMRNSTRGRRIMEEGQVTGQYEHNITLAEVRGFLNVTDLTAGADYVFWSVWGQENGSALELNTRKFDLNRTQYWQCPGTTISRNFEEGATLGISFEVDSSASSIAPACVDTLTAVSTPDHPDDSGDGDDSLQGTSTRKRRAAKTRRRLVGPSRMTRVARSANILDGNEIFCADNDTNSNTKNGYDMEWTWGGGGAATFNVGDRSRIRFSSGVRLDERWSTLRNAGSWANDDGEVVAVIDKFRTRAVYSTLIFLGDEEELLGNSALLGRAAMWVAVALGAFLVWLFGCCTLRMAKGNNAATTWPTAVARAKARACGNNDGDDGDGDGGDDENETSEFGSPRNRDPGRPTSARPKELQQFSMTPTLGARELGSFDSNPLSPYLLSDAAPLAGCTTPGSIQRALNPVEAPYGVPFAASSKASTGRDVRPSRLQVFPSADADVESGVEVGIGMGSREELPSYSAGS